MLSATSLFSTDDQLKPINREKFSTIASDESIAAFKAAGEAKNWPVFVVNTKAEALEKVVSLIPDGATVTSTGSVGLEQIGYTKFGKENPTKWNNLKAKLATEKDPVKLGELYAQANNAEYVVTTPVAVTEAAELLTADLTGTRVIPALGGGKLIVLVGGQKLVKDWEAAHARLRDYVHPLESARARIAYPGVPGSTPAYTGELRSPNPFGAPGRITFVLVKEEVGY